jgi:hypothetical protein
VDLDRVRDRTADQLANVGRDAQRAKPGADLRDRRSARVKRQVDLVAREQRRIDLDLVDRDRATCKCARAERAPRGRVDDAMRQREL